MDDAEEQGYAAARDGLDPSDNPYPNGDPRRTAWADAYQSGIDDPDSDEAILGPRMAAKVQASWSAAHR